jgi:hypothetical protein
MCTLTYSQCGKGGFVPPVVGESANFSAGSQAGPDKAARICPCGPGRTGHISLMAGPEKEQPVMLPFADQAGGGWHVVIRYHEGHERRIDGFASEQEAMEWIIANSGEVNP